MSAFSHSSLWQSYQETRSSLIHTQQSKENASAHTTRPRSLSCAQLRQLRLCGQPGGCYTLDGLAVRSQSHLWQEGRLSVGQAEQRLATSRSSCPGTKGAAETRNSPPAASVRGPRPPGGPHLPQQQPPLRRLERTQKPIV
ncbi:hypothetical protein CB1_000877023 [Camelus ferus]|nr:hypothetical protein CB1_000877023 [Camelus ferus]